MYNWQHKNWPEFKFDSSSIDQQLMKFMLKAGELKGIISALPEAISTDSIIQIMMSEAIKTSEIEGETINRIDVTSSIRKNLGLPISKEPKDKNAIGLSHLLIDVRNSYKQELTESKILEWHKLLMGYNKRINAGSWRKGTAPMQVISGSMSDPKIHFEAPPSKMVPKEMKRFIEWYNKDEISSPIIKAAVAHLYIESIHPFEDGNGRIGRAIAEKALSQGFQNPIMFSISKSIEENRSSYYKSLQYAQQRLEITKWVEWFASIIIIAQDDAEKTIQFTIKKMKFFDKHDKKLNERQKKVINRMLDEGINGFKGGMNAKKYISITETSKATATRDLQELVAMNVFVINGLGRSTSYVINI
ncbi:Fic family protein [Sediminibacterium sp.]|uniref:Fic family protein n=1 Tax=Sediminibacterium sp. TaxID=1917865 RepID=UPI0025F0EA99|nr:Fic family protein [Sediminibacterium sp.]